MTNEGPRKTCPNHPDGNHVFNRELEVADHLVYLLCDCGASIIKPGGLPPSVITGPHRGPRTPKKPKK